MKGWRSGEGSITPIFPAGNRIPERAHTCVALFVVFYIFFRQECIANS